MEDLTPESIRSFATQFERWGVRHEVGHRQESDERRDHNAIADKVDDRFVDNDNKPVEITHNEFDALTKRRRLPRRRASRDEIDDSHASAFVFDTATRMRKLATWMEIEAESAKDSAKDDD